ncbi:MAG: sortase [Anaerolineae bacterium]|nr:sortase [Anaerolineae bacterium]
MNKSFFTKVFSAFLIVMLALGAFPITPAYAATSGPNLPDVGANVNGPGTVNWTNPGNVISNNNVYATVNVNNSTSEYLQATDFDFAIPAASTIAGIQVTIGRFGSTGGGQDIQDNVVQLIKGGSLVGSNLGATGTDWPGAEAAANYGATNNLWGTTWTPAEINDINFGVALAVDSTNARTASVDYIQVTVTYFLNATTVGVATATSGSSSSINVSMPYTDDGDADNTYTVEYCLTSANCPVSGSWTTFVSGAAHSASPFATSITGLVPATSYDVRVTYNDADGVTGTNPQTITNVTTAACGGSLTYTIPAGSDRVVVVIVSSEGGGAIGTPNLSGFGAATLISNPVNGNARIYAGYRVIGTSAVAQATTITATNGTCFYANTYTGINQTAGTGSSNTINSVATGTAAAGTTTTNTSVFNATGGAVVNQAGGRVIYAINMNNVGPSGTGTSGVWTFSELFDGSQTADGNRTAVGQSTTTTAGSAAISVTDGGTAHNRSALVAFALNAVNTNTAPNAPSAINQYRTDATTVIAQGGFTNQTQVVFKATATDPEANQYQLQVEVLPNASAFTNTATCSSPLTNSGTETSTGSCGAFVNGTSYKWQYRLVDSVGAATAWTSFGGSDPDFTVDTTTPDTTITANPPLLTNSSNASFSFTGNDSGGSGVASLQCQLDGGAFSACTSPQSYFALGDGSHTFQVRAIDNAGNVDPTPASYTWTVDTTAPAAPVVTTPANGSVTNDSTPSVSGTAEPNSTVTVYIDGSIAGTTTADGSGNWNFTAAALSDGSHTVRATSTDAAGNTSPSSNTNTFTVDTTAPDTTITANPADPTNSTTASFSFTGSDPGGSGVASFQCQIDGGAFSACTSPQSYLGLSDGSHTFQVRAIDVAGNVDATPASYTWTIDTAAPDTTIDSNPTNPSNDNTPSFTFSSPDLTATFECSIDGGAFSACVTPNTLAALADGPHTFAVRAVDSLGNTDASPASYTWTIDTVSPDTSIDSNPTNPSNDNTPTFTFSSLDLTATFECSIDGGAFSACASPNTLAALADGSHTFAVRAVDPAGNVDVTPASYTWTIDSTAPDTTIDTNPTDPSNDTTPTFTFSSPDLTATFECSIDGGAFSACTSPNTLAALADGPHTFAVRAIDLLGNVDPSPASYAWTINTSAPLVTNITSPNADGTYFAGNNITIEVTFDEAVFVTGTPQLLLELGAVDGLANYVSGSGTNTLTFTYVVVPGDNTPDLDYVATASLTLNGGSIQDAALNNASLTLPNPGAAGSLGANKNIVIDALILVVVNNGVGSVPDTGDGSLSENEQVANTLNINQLVVSFSKDVYDVPASTTDPDEVDNPANYILVRSATGVFNTLSCAGGVVAPDIINPVTSVTYNNGGGSGPFIATVTLSTPLTTDGYYRLFVCGTTSIVQANNTALALAGNGIANGTDFIRNFQLITPAVGGGGGGGAGARDDAKLAVAALPATGFAPGRITALPVQPDELAYSDLGDLWIEIPSLGIKTSIIGVPQTADGEWDVTWLANNVGWLNGTAFPTWEGNSVVTAHVTNADGVDGPFANLKKLKYGDQIIIHLYGQKYIFEVRNSRLSRPFTTGFAFEDLEDASYLTLITCQTYLPKSDTYMHRRVIRAVLISVENE